LARFHRQPKYWQPTKQEPKYYRLPKNWLGKFGHQPNRPLITLSSLISQLHYRRYGQLGEKRSMKAFSKIYTQLITTGMEEEADGWALRRRPNVVAVGVEGLRHSPRRRPSAYSCPRHIPCTPTATLGVYRPSAYKDATWRVG
jgi:hypothetical protein